MKKFRKALVMVGATLMIGLTSAAIVSCKKDDNTVKYVFETNGGEKVSSVNVKVGKEYELPIPERDGYEFEGWYLNENFTGEAVVSVVAEADVTYYAKWAKLYTINLDLKGGTLDETALQLKEGGNVYEFMQAYVPTKAGLQFGAWFKDGAEISTGLRMPASDITLEAKYKAAYTVEIWRKDTETNEYVKDETDLQGWAYVDENFVSKQKFTGFKEVIVDGSTVAQKTISENAADNVFRHYFEKETYTVTFRANYPDGSDSVSDTVTVIYGEEVTVPSDYVYEGWCLLGWAKSKDGEIVYKSNFLENAIYNKDSATKVEDVTFVPDRNTTLYAVWNRGYTDMFGSNDYVYVIDETSNEIYLSRGDVFFKGKYIAAKKEFLFIGGNNNVLRQGRLLDDERYIYYQESRATSSTLFVSGKGLVESEKIYFDEYNGITYSIADGDNKTTQSVGTYVVDENGYYVATFTEGEGKYVGKSLTFITGTTTSNGEQVPAFQIRDEEVVALGDLVKFVVVDGVLTYYTAAYQMRFTGFGTVMINQGFNAASYYYSKDGDVVVLKNMYGQTQDTVRIIEQNGVKGYISYQSVLDQEFTTVNGGTLLLDGMCNVKYTVDGKTVSGYYTTASSVFGGVIVNFTVDQTAYKFLITATTEDRPVEGGAEGETEKVNVYTVAEKLNTYAEYYYFNENGPDYAPMLVIDDPKAGEAILYGYTKSRTYVEVSRGTYEYDEKTNLYTYTAVLFAEADTLVDVVTPTWDISTVKKVVFALDSTSTNYSVNYWYSVETEGETEVPTFSENKYVGANGATLTIVSGMGIYEADGQLLSGAVATKNGLTVLQSPNGTAYFELNEEEKTFLKLQHAPYNAKVLAENGQERKDAIMYFDGKGGAVYSELVKDEEGNYIKNEDGTWEQKDYVGTFVQTEDTTAFGSYICKFTADDNTKSFTFLQLSASSTAYVAIYNETYNGEYESELGFLTLDGYGFMASYASMDGKLYEGVYTIPEENVVSLSTQEDGVFYFDLTADGFTLRGQEYGTYLGLNNQAMYSVYFELDGYGKLSVRSLETAEGEEEVVMNGTYTIDGDVVTFTYSESENKEIVLVGEFGTYQIGSYLYNAFIVSRTEVMTTFVNAEDWSVMILDDLGNAIKYSSDGKKVVGSYMTITDELIYFVSADGEQANIYKYNVQEGKIEAVLMESRGYYTENLESLLFTEYGFAIFNGAIRYYYNIVNNNVTIYRQDIDNPSANKYGFVEENFGEFAQDTVIYDNKTYYYNDGYALLFTRSEETKNEYPVLVKEAETEEEEDTYSPLANLTFAPTGAANFSNVAGSVVINGTAYNCYVTRKVTTDDDGNVTDVEMYLNVGSYRFDIEVTYTGVDEEGNSTSTYKVTRMRLMSSYISYMYMDMYYYYYMRAGAGTANQIQSDWFGTVSISREFDKDGVEFEGGPYFEGTFGEASGMYDANGELIQIEQASYESASNGKMMTVEFVGKDTYTYRLYIGIQQHQAFRQNGYVIYALTRVQTFTSESGYTVEVERVVATEIQSVYKGYPLYLNMKQGETEVPKDSLIIMEGYLYYITRTYEENEDGTQGKITGTNYYRIEFTEDTSGGVLEEDSPVVLPYASVEVTLEVAETKYTADSTSYVDMVGDEVKLLSIEKVSYFAKTTTKNEDGSYTVLTTYGTSYLVTVAEDGTVAIEEIVEEDEETKL